MDGLQLYFNSNRPEGDTETCGHIWVATRATTEDEWTEPFSLGPPINTSDPSGYPCISADGLELYLSDGYPGFYMEGCTSRSGGYGYGDIWVSKRNALDLNWSEPVNLGSAVNNSNYQDGPSISADGLSLFFYSAYEADTYGRVDLYVTTRASKDDSWGTRMNIGPPVNTSDPETFSHISADGLSLLFCREISDDVDIYLSRRTTPGDPWGEPIRLDALKSSGDESGVTTSPNCSMIYFARGDRYTGEVTTTFLNSWDIWQTEVTPVVDLNSDGIVDALDVTIMVDNWHTYNTLCDIAPAPLGDGFVDIQDLTVLAEYLFEEIPAP